MNKLTNNPLNDLNGSLLKTKNSNYDFDVIKEIETQPPQIEEKKEIEKDLKPIDAKEETKEVIKETQQKDDDETKKKPKTYRLPPQLISDIEKIVYMDRELRGNETTLITKALESYVYSKENKELIKQYDELKGNK